MSLEDKLDNIVAKKILVIGDIMLDRYYFGTAKRISPEAPVPVLLKKNEKIVLGGAANVAINIKKAKQHVSVLSVIGEDVEGDILISLLEENNIDSSLIIKDEKRCTCVKNRFIGQNNIQMFRLDEEITDKLDEDANKKILDLLEKNIKKYDIVIISDYNKGLLNPENTKRMIEIANKNNVRTLIDVKEPSYEKYKNAYLIKPNLSELHDITKMPVDTEKQIVKAAQTLLENTNCKYVLATRGKDGMTLVSKDEYKHIECMSRDVYDVTGAGDTVISYLSTCLANNIELIDSIQIANYAAGVGVSKMGTYAVTIEEIKEYIEKDNNISYENKVVTAKQLSKILKEKKNKKVVFTNGCFDLFHIGHARYLREASKLGDILVVGVNSDASVKRLKGSQRPIINQEERMELLASLSFVSYVVMFEEDTPAELIKEIQPDIITKGGDYKPEDVVGKDIVEAKGGKVVICPFVQSHSTTSIINKIKGE
jgi:D-beta-D-heptose 7-phosphate kinase/D-beta-D-heptose 1-phosphate adenosyltransferase